MGLTKFYDPDRVSCTWAGIEGAGWAEGNFCTIEKVEDNFVYYVGVDGNVTRSKKKHPIVRVTWRLAQSSDVNALLSAAHLLDLTAPNGQGVGPMQIRDVQGTSLFFAASAWIVKWPTQDFDAQAGPREWIFDCVEDLTVVGGN